MTLCALSNVTKRYGKQWALHGVSTTLDASQIVGLVGPNGSGKTTLMRIVAGLLRPSAGQVLRSTVARGTIRYFAGERTLPPGVTVDAWSRLWTGRRNHEFGRGNIATLSRGMRQQLGLETVLSTNGDSALAMLLLDEPWEGLDPDASRWLSARLVERRAQGVCVLVSSHRIHDLAGICDRCIFLRRGLVADEVRMACSMAAGVDRSTLLFEAFDRLSGTEIGPTT